MEIQYYTPQVITIFIPDFKEKLNPRVWIAEIEYPNDWVEFCNKADEDYGIWFMTLREAQNAMGKEITNSIKV